MKAAHSPAPWVACISGPEIETTTKDGKPFRYFPHVHLGPADHGRTYISADGSTQEARSDHTTINEGSSLEICDANALLISTAPDGLALARQVVAMLSPVVRHNTEKQIDKLRTAALALIAKATEAP